MAAFFVSAPRPAHINHRAFRGGAYGVVSVTFSVGRSLPGVGSPIQRNVTMFGIFKKKTRRAAAEIKKFEKRDLAQAVINAAYLVAYADGECEASEKAKIEQVLRNQPALSAFTSEINAISATITGQLDTNFKIGRRAALREIEDVKHDTREAEDVLDVAVAIAEADGEIEPEERKVLEEIAGVLGLRLENHL